MSADETKRLEKKLDELTSLTQAGFSKMDERVKAIELKQARQEGRDSVVNGTKINWGAILLSLAKALGIAIGLAYLLAEALLK